ncbi:glycosyltransferase BC10-like isoform X2 [Impatiens glandulifera]|uniref:glycosyltransferase BC10-like isoform X2 n=1 Tax=Impatiens glandulifera TaxID=253017 RepID=UPI001FB08905|nr:glycosyltransferase BC10-like isoform X2 [Impatiens glandulifera]
MKTVLHISMKDSHTSLASRQRTHQRKPTWILVLVLLVSMFLVCAYIYPPKNPAACYVLFTSSGCKGLSNWLPPAPAREFTDSEIASRVVIREVLSKPPIESKNPKVAFMFLIPGPLPFEKLWDKFFQGHEGRFSVYVHTSMDKPVHSSRYFINREIQSDKVDWGKISMVDAERRLLGHALKNTDNQHFVLLSESFEDPGPHGNGRYSNHMLPEVEKKDFRKGSQWFTLKRQHAIVVMADSLYYTKFRDYCKPGMDGRNCYSDEHYLPTFFHMFDPTGIANWSVTHVDWSERKWHPKSYNAHDVTSELLRKIASIDISTHETSDEKRMEEQRGCMWNGIQRPCYLFGRKFMPDAIDNLISLFSNYTSSI